MKRATLLTLCACLAGCKLTPDRFIERFVDIRCSNEAECRPDLFTSTWGDDATCQSTLGDAWSTALDQYEALDCDFDIPQAKTCLEAAQSASCDTWESWRWFDNSCFRVWVCPLTYIDTADTGQR